MCLIRYLNVELEQTHIDLLGITRAIELLAETIYHVSRLLEKHCLVCLQTSSLILRPRNVDTTKYLYLRQENFNPSAHQKL